MGGLNWKHWLKRRRRLFEWCKGRWSVYDVMCERCINGSWTQNVSGLYMRCRNIMKSCFCKASAWIFSLGPKGTLNQ